MKVKTDINSFLDAYETLKVFKAKYDEVMNKLRNVAISRNTKYSVIIAAKENKIQTDPNDKAYNFEVEAFHLRRIIEISIHALEKQIKIFQKSFYPRYANEIMKLRNNIVAKNLKSCKIWEKIQNLTDI